MLSAHADEDGKVRQRSGWRPAIIVASIIYLGVKALVSLLSLVVVWLHSGPAPTDAAAMSPLPPLPGIGFFGALHHWDSAYFLSIATDGYFPAGAGSSVQAFFPGFPLLSRVVSEIVTGRSSTPASLIFSLWLVGGLAAWGATIVLFRLTDEMHSQRVARLTVLLFLVGPYSVFLFANYSESVFLLFAVAAWYCAVVDRWALVGIFATMATFTRINGIFLVAALLVMYLLQRRRAGQPVATRELLWLPVAGVGIGAYFGFLMFRTGDPFAWLHAQGAGWGRGFSWPWEAFYQTAGRVIFASTLDRRIQFGLDIVFAAAIGLSIMVLLRRRQWPEVTYLGLTLLAFTTSFTLVSIGRSTVALFPIVILAASAVVGGKTRFARIVLPVGWMTLFVVNTLLFANGYWTD